MITAIVYRETGRIELCVPKPVPEWCPSWVSDSDSLAKDEDFVCQLQHRICTEMKENQIRREIHQISAQTEKNRDGVIRCDNAAINHALDLKRQLDMLQNNDTEWRKHPIVNEMRIMYNL